MRRFTLPTIVAAISLVLIVVTYFVVSAAPATISDSSVYDAQYSGPENAAIGRTGSFAVSDINGDSKDDLIIGDPTDNSTTGAVYIYFGGKGYAGNKTISDPNEYDLKITGLEANDQFGTYINTGDLNGDNHPDLIIYSETPSNSNAGAWHIFFSTLIASHQTSGTKEYAVTNAGAFSVRYNFTLTTGKAGLLPSALTTRTNNMQFADLSADGKRDWVLGSWSDNILEGSVFVLYSHLFESLGTTTGTVRSFGNTTDYTFKLRGEPGAARLSGMGVSVADVNQDTFLDLIVANDNDTSVAYLYVIDSAQISDFAETTGNELNLSDPNTYIVRYRCTVNINFEVGDVNADGYADLVLAVPRSQAESYVAIIYSTRFAELAAVTTRGLQVDPNNSLQYNILISSNDPLDYQLGSDIKIGDINTDGLDDLYISGGYAATLTNWVFFSTFLDDFTIMSNTLDIAVSTSYSAILSTTDNDNNNGDSVESFGKIVDLNNDGDNDLLLANRLNDSNGNTDSGVIFAINATLFQAMGTTTGNTLDPAAEANHLFTYVGPSTDTLIGSNQSVLTGNLTPDNATSLVVGAPTVTTNGTNSGTIWVIHQNNTDTTGPTITIPSAPTEVTQPAAITLIGNVSDASNKLSGISYDVDNQNNWTTCTITDGLLDEFNEDFSCSIASSLLTVASHTITVGSTDSLSNLTSVEFTVLVNGTGTTPTVTDTASPTPTATVTPTATTTATPTVSPTTVITTIAPYCGDGKINGSEQCDGNNSINNKSCMDHDPMYTYGTVACSNLCKLDTTNCSLTAPTTDTPTATVTASITATPLAAGTLSLSDLLSQYGPILLVIAIVLVVLMIYFWIKNTKV